MEKESALKRRLGRSTPLKLELEEEGGGKLVRNFRLCFDFNALTLVEERTGFSLLGFDIWRNPSCKTVGILLWAGILAHHPEYDCEEGLRVIRSYLDVGKASEVSAALFEAFLVTLPKDQQERLRNPDPEPGEAKPQPDAASSTGAKLGPSPDTISASMTASSAG